MEMQIMAWLAASLVFTAFFMKTIVPLRVLGIGGNIVFILYALLGIHHGIFDKVLPILVLHAALLPLNIFRLKQITDTIRSVRDMKQGVRPYDFLIPFMEKRSYPAGKVLFNKGDRADLVYVLARGQVLLPDVGKLLATGSMFGEVSVFAENAQRTATAVCEGDCEIYCIRGEKMLELFYQDQRFAFQIARALSGYAAADSTPIPDSQRLSRAA
jgi:hypothetical protein